MISEIVVRNRRRKQIVKEDNIMPKIRDIFGIEEPAPITYFSEREEGEISRENEEIDDNAWGGIQAR